MVNTTYLTRTALVEELKQILDDSGLSIEPQTRTKLENLLERAEVEYNKRPATNTIAAVENSLLTRPHGLTYSELADLHPELSKTLIRQIVLALKEKHGNNLTIEPHPDPKRKGMYGKKPMVISLHKQLHARLEDIKKKGRPRVRVSAVEKAAGCDTQQAEKILRFHCFMIKKGVATP